MYAYARSKSSPVVGRPYFLSVSRTSRRTVRSPFWVWLQPVKRTCRTMVSMSATTFSMIIGTSAGAYSRKIWVNAPTFGSGKMLTLSRSPSSSVRSTAGQAEKRRLRNLLRKAGEPEGLRPRAVLRHQAARQASVLYPPGLGPGLGYHQHQATSDDYPKSLDISPGDWGLASSNWLGTGRWFRVEW